MKKIFVIVAALTGLSALTACHGRRNERLAEGEFVIEGKLPAERYEGAWLYMVPMRGPEPKPVDSVTVARDGSFRFTGNVEQVAVLRLDWHVRFGIQELLVVTEPGVTRVRLDSISSCIEGTPQNMLLQEWKEHQQNFLMARAKVGKMRQERISEEIWKPIADSAAVSQGEFIYQLLTTSGPNTATRFIGTMLSGRIDSTRRAELKELLADTIDYTKPQPGFRR
ncbi:MAG: DUF4369 domain-containing protein [Bacteroidales bacterium]|nr:DUF4369 domain-containing protein [Bacteroidales bacterium]